MPYVIVSPCVDVKDTACVEVCPVDCIHSTDDEPQYYIDAETCIDCGACEPVCPVQAIYHEDLVPDEEKEYVQKNVDFYERHPELKG